MLFESNILDLLKLLPAWRKQKEKNKIRELLTQKRRLLTADDIATFSAQVVEHLEQLPCFQTAKSVMIYYPTHNELDVLSLIKKYKREKTFLLPVSHRHYMEACPYEGNAKMHRGKFNIPEPTTPPFAGKIDLIIMPGVAFDKHGSRLGHGRGYYDKFIAVNRSSVRIGVGYDFQLINHVPTRWYDKRVNYVVTPSKVVAI